MWKEILLKVLNGDKNIPSPFDKAGVIESKFVMVNKETRLGFLWIWCSKTQKGIHISRLKIPENVEYLYNDDFKKLKLPAIKFVDQSK